MSAADKVAARLKEIADKFSGSVNVGFLENATYDDGTPVAAVAFWNEYGASGPPRPFFRNMIADESPTWGGKVGSAAKATDFDGQKILNIMGDNIQGALIKSINDFTTPGNAESTIARKGFDKPLIDTSHMVNSTGWEVNE